MEAILNSFLLVAATEMGDKTQLLAFVLATRFHRPWSVMAGIFVATVANHFVAAAFGSWAAGLVAPETLRWILALVFFAFAAWVLIPDTHEDGESTSKYGAFITTVIAFFLAEMGDKTQLSTVALAARYDSLLSVTVGTTLGMMFSDGLAVMFGEKLHEKISMKWVRRGSAFLFVIFGLLILFVKQ